MHINYFQQWNEYLGRMIPIITAYLLYILCGIHLGFHYNNIVKLKKETKIALNIFWLLIAFLFGIKAFIKRKIINKLSLSILYPIYFDENIIVSLLDYASI